MEKGKEVWLKYGGMRYWEVVSACGMKITYRDAVLGSKGVVIET